MTLPTASDPVPQCNDQWLWQPATALRQLPTYNMTMVAFKGYFDGRVIIPSGPISLPRDRELLFQVAPNLPQGISGKALLELIDSIGFDKESVDQMAAAIEKDCERIDGEW